MADIDSAIAAVLGSRQPGYEDIAQGRGMGVDPLPRPGLTGPPNLSSVPPWLIPILAATGLRGRGGMSRNIPTKQPERPRTEVGNIVRQHFGQDNVNPRTRMQELNSSISGRNQTPFQRNATTTPQSFPGTPISGPQGISPNMRTATNNPVAEAMHGPMDRLSRRRIMSPANSILDILSGN